MAGRRPRSYTPPRLDDDITRDVREWAIDPDRLPSAQDTKSYYGITDIAGQYFRPVLPVIGKADVFVQPHSYDPSELSGEQRADWLISYLRHQKGRVARGLEPRMGGKEAVDYYGSPASMEPVPVEPSHYESTRQHELGHHLWFTRMTDDQRRQWEGLHDRHLMPSMREGHYRRATESFPEVYSLFKTNPERLREMAPDVYKWLSALIGSGWDASDPYLRDINRGREVRDWMYGRKTMPGPNLGVLSMRKPPTRRLSKKVAASPKKREK